MTATNAIARTTATTPATGAQLIEEQAVHLRRERAQTVDRQGKDRSGWHLETVRDDLLARKTMLQARDLERSPSQLMVRFGANGRPAVGALMRPGQSHPEELLHFTRRGLQQLAERILPTRGLGFLQHLAVDGPERRRERDVGLATMTWATFALRHTNPVLLRTELDTSAEGKRLIRASLSQSYVTYDHHTFLTDVLDQLGPDAHLYRVADYRLDDGALRLRMVGGSREALETWARKEVNKPMPTVQLYNGEYGNSAVYVRPGTFTLWCSNGCGTWDRQANWRWNHSGSAQQRIRRGVRGAITEAQVASQGIVDAYEQALDTALDNAWDWFAAETEQALTGTQQEAVRTAMLQEPTVQANAGLLTQVVDAVTWVAQQQTFDEQARMERLAGQLLNRGLQQAQGGRLAAPVAFA